MWVLPGPRTEPMFSALAGGYLATGPYGSPSLLILKFDLFSISKVTQAFLLHHASRFTFFNHFAFNAKIFIFKASLNNLSLLIKTYIDLHLRKYFSIYLLS